MNSDGSYSMPAPKTAFISRSPRTNTAPAAVPASARPIRPFRAGRAGRRSGIATWAASEQRHAWPLPGLLPRAARPGARRRAGRSVRGGSRRGRRRAAPWRRPCPTAACRAVVLRRRSSGGGGGTRIDARRPWPRRPAGHGRRQDQRDQPGSRASKARVMPAMPTRAPARPVSPSTTCQGRNWPPAAARTSRSWKVSRPPARPRGPRR